MDPLGQVADRKALDEDAAREKQLNEFVLKARKLRPRKVYPTAKPLPPKVAAEGGGEHE